MAWIDRECVYAVVKMDEEVVNFHRCTLELLLCFVSTSWVFFLLQKLERHKAGQFAQPFRAV